MTAKIVTTYNSKGGSGKTCISMNVAGTLGIRGFKTLVIDMDPQGTASRWYSAAPDEKPFPADVVSMAAMEGKVHRAIQNHVEQYDVIIVDCPPSMTSSAPNSALLVADLALIPMILSPADLWAAEAAKTLVEQVQITNDTLIARMVANNVDATSLAEDMANLLMEDQEIPLLKSTLGHRTAYRDALVFGCTVHGVPRAKTAIAEVEALTSEISALIDIPKKAKAGRK